MMRHVASARNKHNVSCTKNQGKKKKKPAILNAGEAAVKQAVWNPTDLNQIGI